ncbi:MAG TPA: hypothetical protein VK705_06030 [Ferruginibacter sp.]|jgi:hypothetical protein|nr:hypothetical protein [Ferruginibacter sp.]
MEQNTAKDQAPTSSFFKILKKIGLILQTIVTVIGFWKSKQSSNQTTVKDN